MTPLLDLADAELAQLIATAALLPVEKRAGFVQQAAGATWRDGLGSGRPVRPVLE
jgi:hypothetical protein